MISRRADIRAIDTEIFTSASLQFHHEVERGCFAGASIMNLQQQLWPEERITLVLGRSSEIELCRQHRPVWRHHFDMDVWRPARVLPGHDALQHIPAGAVRELVAAQTVPGVIIRTSRIGLPEVQACARHGPAGPAEDLTGDNGVWSR